MKKITIHIAVCAYVEVRIRKWVLSRETPCLGIDLNKQEMNDGRKMKVKTMHIWLVISVVSL